MANTQNLETIKDQKPFVISGNLEINWVLYGAKCIPSRAETFSYVLSGYSVVSIYGIELPFSAIFSDKGRSYSQPFNQFGLSPYYKWITLHGGYRNITFSSFSLAGHTFLGGGIELNPGIFRFGFVYGRFNRKTTENPLDETDPLPTFTRKGYAIKLGVGTENNFFDLVFLRIRDDSTSLDQVDTMAIRTPQQNVVAGFNSHFTFFKKLTLEVEAAVSLLTDDLSAKPSLDSTSSAILKSLGNYLAINQSSEYYTAFRSSLSYNEENWALGLEYNRIDPGYISMGAYYFNDDLENISIKPSLKVLRGKLDLSGSIGIQRDNLHKTKAATTVRTIGDARISYNPAQVFGLEVNYNNYRMKQRGGRLPITDSLKIYQITQNFTFTPRILFVNEKQSHTCFLIYNLIDYNDKNIVTSAYSCFRLQTTQLLYVIGLNKKNWSFNFGVTFTSNTSAFSADHSESGTFGVSKSWLDERLLLNWDNSLTYLEQFEAKGWVLNSTLTGSYEISKHHTIRMNLSFIGNYTVCSPDNPSFNEGKGDFTYVYTF